MSSNELATPWRVFADAAQIFERADGNAPITGTLKRDSDTFGQWIVEPTTGEPWLELIEGKGFVSLTQLHRIRPQYHDIVGNLELGTEDLNRWWGIPLEYEPDDLIQVPEEFCISDGKDYRLRAPVVEKLRSMMERARSEGINFYVISAYRSGPYQRKIYQRACDQDGRNQRYSAPPGHSEHQLGTTVDLCDLEKKFAFEEEFGSTKEGVWLEQYASDFGFQRTYRQDNTQLTGYIPEAWHWRCKG